MKRIALVGDYSDTVVAHRAIPIALKLAVDRLKVSVSWDWIHSRSIVDARDALSSFAGVWCVPGSPYENTDGVLSAIRFVRESGRPFLGTCGGFQHALIEYAQNVWGMTASHAEIEPNATDPVIAPLACALVEMRGALHFAANSRLAKIYATETATEEYHCSYGLNPAYAARLAIAPMQIAARDDQGDVRAFELTNHPFYFGTLFQPERAALRDRIPSLVLAFVSAVAQA